ncbi:MAG: ATP-binding protein [Myxococcales bacterium]|nr:ATP-binding protein [Myxococcales bacterium]MDH3482614.1 ATP-binding protein [Myxococcales bacterium]
MSSLSTRVVVLFALVAIFPVALTAVVWFGMAAWGGDETNREAELVERHVRMLDEQRDVAVTGLCRDDLVVDRLLTSRTEDTPSELDYDRLFRGAMRGAGLQALWILDSRSGEVIAAGHTNRIIGRDGSALIRQARLAGEQPFTLTLGEQDHQKFVARACTIERGGAGVTVVGAHRFTDIRALDPDRILIVDEASARDLPIAELADAEGVAKAAVIWRSGIDRAVPPLFLWMGCVALLALGLALLFGGYLNRWLQSSINELTEAATRIGAGDFATTLREGQPGAFRATATAFNRMTRDLRNAQEQLRQTERVAAWQEIAKRLAHELKNPLSPIRLSIETLRKAHARSRDDFDALFDESTKTILQEVERLRQIVDEFSRFARLPAPTLRETDLREIVPQAVSLYASEEVAVSAELPGHPVRAQVDPDQITQVLHNLLQNASDAARKAHPNGGGRVRVTLEEMLHEVRVRVEDNGAGIPDDQADLIFEPYFTDKKGGTGLGLAITSRIVTEHRGRIDVESRPGKTTFTVTLPQ